MLNNRRFSNCVIGYYVPLDQITSNKCHIHGSIFSSPQKRKVARTFKHSYFHHKNLTTKFRIITLTMIPILFVSEVKGKICRMAKLSSRPASVFSVIRSFFLFVRAKPTSVDHWANAISSGLAAYQRELQIILNWRKLHKKLMENLTNRFSCIWSI